MGFADAFKRTPQNADSDSLMASSEKVLPGSEESGIFS